MRIFGMEKCKLIANFSATMMTSLPSLSHEQEHEPNEAIQSGGIIPDVHASTKPRVAGQTSALCSARRQVDRCC